MSPDPLRITAITAEQTRPLRWEVLRAGLPAEMSVFDGDDLPTTVHLGAWRGEKLVGVTTLVWQDPPRDGPGRVIPPGEAIRLRGMAVEEQSRGGGVGSALLRACFTQARAAGRPILWCNARVPAADFYQRHGLIRVGDIFDIPTAGPHYLMYRQLH